MRALRNRPTALERWTSGVREGMKLATGPQDKDADAFYQKRVPKGAPDYLESVQITFPAAAQPTRSVPPRSPCRCGVPTWAPSSSTPGPYAATTSTTPTSSGSTSTRSPAPPSPTRSAWPASRRSCSRSWAWSAPEDQRQPRRPHLRADQAGGEFVDVRHAAIGFGRELAKRDDGVTVDWWKEERGERIFVDFNQNNRDRTIASAYSLRPIAGAPVSTPMTWDELADDRPSPYNLFTVPDRLSRRRPLGLDRRHRRTRWSRCSRCGRSRAPSS